MIILVDVRAWGEGGEVTILNCICDILERYSSPTTTNYGSLTYVDILLSVVSIIQEQGFSTGILKAKLTYRRSMYVNYLARQMKNTIISRIISN